MQSDPSKMMSYRGAFGISEANARETGVNYRDGAHRGCAPREHLQLS